MAAYPEKQTQQWLLTTQMQPLRLAMTGILPLLLSFLVPVHPPMLATTGIFTLLSLLFRERKPIVLLNLALVFFLTMIAAGILTVANNQIDGVFPSKYLPVELQDKVIGYAMMATNREISLPCLTNAPYKPGINTSLFLVNHRVYHEAHHQLRKQNIFIFGNYGSDLQTLASSIGPLNCRLGNCGHGALRSILAKMVLDIGDEEMPGFANDKVHAFRCALQYLRPQIMVNSLHIRIAYYSFRNSVQLSDFACALSKIKVQEKLTVTGDEHILDMSIEDFPRKLGMGTLPVKSHFRSYHGTSTPTPRTFLRQYRPQTQLSEDADPKQEHPVTDPTDSS